LRKSQEGRRVALSILWIAGVGLEQLPGTGIMTFNRGGTFFDKQGNHMLGDGSSPARR